MQILSFTNLSGYKKKLIVIGIEFKAKSKHARSIECTFFFVPAFKIYPDRLFKWMPQNRDHSIWKECLIAGLKEEKLKDF